MALNELNNLNHIPLALRKAQTVGVMVFLSAKVSRISFYNNFCHLLFFRVDSLPKYDTIDAVPTQLEPEFRTPGRVLQEIRPLDPNTTDSPDGPVKQNLEFRFSVGQLPSWAQKRVSGIYSKTCVKRPLKSRQAKILMTNGSLMKVESIAECSILQYFLTCIKR